MVWGKLMEIDMRLDTRSYGERLEEILREMAGDEARKMMAGGIPDCADPDVHVWIDEPGLTYVSRGATHVSD